ncbi:MAG: hypothetical protein RMX68_014485 [Aulosira sp. ZfuVER01]|nr:hypothetical protein [Aulosira sp. DedVER01a]MDZ8056407.1 hypothetical protein [Aulosira sp. ZfuCHP01]
MCRSDGDRRCKILNQIYTDTQVRSHYCNNAPYQSYAIAFMLFSTQKSSF